MSDCKPFDSLKEIKNLKERLAILESAVVEMGDIFARTATPEQLDALGALDAQWSNAVNDLDQ